MVGASALVSHRRHHSRVHCLVMGSLNLVWYIFSLVRLVLIRIGMFQLSWRFLLERKSLFIFFGHQGDRSLQWLLEVRSQHTVLSHLFILNICKLALERLLLLRYSQVLDVRLELLQQNEGQRHHRFRLDAFHVLSFFTKNVKPAILTFSRCQGTRHSDDSESRGRSKRKSL